MSTSFFGSKVEGADQRENAPPPQLRGAGYRLRQALDSVGAFVGPLLAVAFMVWFANDIRAVMWVAVVPAFITVALPVLYVHKHAHVGTAAQARLPWPTPSGCRGAVTGIRRRRAMGVAHGVHARLTGLTNLSRELGGKWLELLKEAVQLPVSRFSTIRPFRAVYLR
jgi:hypothetical protein